MKKSSLVLYQGNGFAIQGPRRFEKDILRVGNWTHPLTGQPVQITQERIERLAADTELYRETCDRKAIPFPDGHTFDAKKNLGYWTGFRVDGDRLIGTVEVTDEEAARKIEQGSIRSVSARIDPDVRDTRGRVFAEAFTHVCATPIPVLDGQQDFVKLSREADPVDLLIPANNPGTSPGGDKRKEIPMFKALALALGLAEDADEAKILAALKTRDEELKTAAAKVKTFEGLSAVKPEDLKAHGFEIKDGKVVKLAAPPADETPREKALREEVESLKKAQALSRQEQLQQTVDSFVKAGQLPPAGKTIADRMLSRVKEAQSLMLSGDPAESFKRFSQVMDENNKDLVELMKVLPKATGEQLSAGEQDEAKKAEELSQKKIDEIAERTQGKPAATK